MTTVVHFLATAEDDIYNIGDYILSQSRSDDVANAFVARLVRHCDHIAALPGRLGTERPDLSPDIRSTPHSGYVIFFRYTAYGIDVVNILHSSRNVEAHFQIS